MIVMHDFSGGGTEHVAVRLANEWAASGRTVRIFCGYDKGPVRALVNPGVTIEKAFPPLPRGRFSRARLGAALAEAAQVFRPDIIFAPGNYHLPVLTTFSLNDRSGARTVCKISNPLLRRRGLSARMRSLSIKFMTAHVDMLVAMSPKLQTEAAELIGADKVVVRWEPIFERGWLTRDSDMPREPGLVVAAGRLEPQKNFGLAIEAFASTACPSEARLVILGEGSERPKLEAMIDRLGLRERVRLPGRVSDVGTWLRRASCFLMTSHFEGYPAILAEAVACGAAALVTPCSSAVEEILSCAAIGAIVVPDAEVIARALGAVLKQPRHQWAEPILLERHDQQRAAASYLALLDRLMERVGSE